MGLLKSLIGFRKWTQSIRPRSDFNVQNVPKAPSYEDLSYWAAHPEVDSKVFFKPIGIEEEALPMAADVFYIHPTSYFGSHNWNDDFNNPQATELIEEAMIPTQASAFNSCCRVFAPRYRQATFYTFLKNTKNGRKALDLAYTDVYRAFQYFLKYENKGRPFFIAAHSQGTCHAIRLLEEFVDRDECVQRLIAAYAVGYQFPLDKFTSGHFQHIKIAENPTDTQCVVAWDSYLDKGKPMHFFDSAVLYYPDKKKWVKRAFKKVLGVNPLTWERTLTKAGSEKYLGGIMLKQANPSKINRRAFGTNALMHLDSIGIQPPIMEKITVELRKDGFVYCSEPKSKFLKRMLLPSGNLHNYDFTLFYMNLRENIKERFLAFQKNNKV